MRTWLLLGVVALALAGIFSLLLVLARTPFFQEIIPYRDFFQTALVVHVNLSVLVWSLSMICVLWGMNIVSAFRWRYAFIFIAALGVLLFTASAFMGEANPLLNNYVPVLQTPWFFLGLGLFGLGIILQGTVTFITLLREAAKHFEIISIAIITLIAIAAFIASFVQANAPEVRVHLGAEEYYELLFWGGGHVLQLSYTQAMAITWVGLASAVGFSSPYLKKALKWLCAATLIAALLTPIPYIRYTITDYEYLDFFTQQMRYGAALLPLVIGGMIMVSWFKSKRILKYDPVYNTLVISIVLFGVGGILGFTITGVNTHIPAHYHGSIVGVALAFMGLTYLLLPLLGYSPVHPKLGAIQPLLYGGGQLLHIVGLAWSGGYGALRKTPGAVQSIEGQAAMGLMGLGGLLAIIGGLLFVVLVGKAIYVKKINPVINEG